MHRRTPLLALLVLALSSLSAAPAAAAGGYITDPAGDYPDIRRLSYTNAATKVVMVMRYTNVQDAQNESFYIRWGTKSYYQVFYSKSGGMKELRYNGNKVACGSLSVTRLAAKESTRAVIPRSCLPQAPNRLKFKGIATAGLYSIDKTALSPWVNRG